MATGSYDCVVLDGTVVTAADIGRYDIAIKDGKIALLAPALALKDAPAKRVINAEGAYVMVSKFNCSDLMANAYLMNPIAWRHRRTCPPC